MDIEIIVGKHSSNKESMKLLDDLLLKTRINHLKYLKAQSLKDFDS